MSEPMPPNTGLFLYLRTACTLPILKTSPPSLILLSTIRYVLNDRHVSKIGLTTMSKKVKISKIQINIGEKTLELSLKEAEELREILNETFGKTVSINPIPTIIRERPNYWDYPRWTVTSSNTGTVDSSVSWGDTQGSKVMKITAKST